MKKIAILFVIILGFVGLSVANTTITLKSGKKIVIDEPIISIIFQGMESESSSLNKTPDGAIKLLFKNVKAGQMGAVKSTLISSGYLDNFDAERLRTLFASENIMDIETKLLNEKNQRAEVLIILVTKSGKRSGKKPVELVFQDGGWKINYSGMSWPSSLTPSNY